MRANELRIGNLVNYSDDNLNCVIKCILEFGLDVETSEEVFYTEYDRFSPIPLTEEWLFRFGFEKDDVFDKIFTYLPLHDLCMDKLSFRKSDGFICYDGIKYRTLLKHIQYVHQLQNLYFALTGEELTLKTEL
jgi:hypothetical protein